MWRRALAGTTLDLLGIFLYGSESDTGMVALAAGVCVMLFFVFPDMKKKSRILLASVGGAAVVLISIMLVTGDFGEHFFVKTDTATVKNMETDFNSVIITFFNQKRIRVTMNSKIAENEGWSKGHNISELLTLSDETTGERIALKNESDSRGVIHENEYPSISFYLGHVTIPSELTPLKNEENRDVLYIRDGDYEFCFGTYWGSNLCYIYQSTLKTSTLRNVDRIGFEGKYSFASGRGYIWACTIPLLKNYLILGAGQDNFIHVFPNDDYVGREISGFDGLFISKPHNMFLGIWVQQGLIALLAFLFLYALFMIRAIRLCYGKNKVVSSPGFSAKGVVIMTAVGTSAYMVAGLANDTVVGVAHLYWILLGIGYAAESICRRQKTTLQGNPEDALDLS